jgi:hypothetical protein
MRKKRTTRLKPLSLYPMKLDEALKAALSTPPPKQDVPRPAATQGKKRKR